jgi:hypothetical protein
MCRPYTRPMDGRKTCGSDNCVGRQVLQENGVCAICPDYLIPNESGRGCFRPKCAQGLINAIDGSCYKKTCDPGRTLNSEGYCIKDGEITVQVGVKTEYRVDKGHCVRVSDGGWNQNLSKVYRLISVQTCEQLCNLHEDCVAFEEYYEFN